MKYLALCLGSGALALAGSASAGTSAPTTATPATTVVSAPRAKTKKPQRVCRERQRSGSHLSNIVCKTAEEWAALQSEVDDQDEYGVPGNRAMTTRTLDVTPGNIDPRTDSRMALPR